MVFKATQKNYKMNHLTMKYRITEVIHDRGIVLYWHLIIGKVNYRVYNKKNMVFGYY